MDIKIYHKINRDLDKKFGFSFNTIMNIIHPGYQFLNHDDFLLGDYITSIHSLTDELTNYLSDKSFFSGAYYMGHSIYNQHLKNVLKKYLKSICGKTHMCQTSLLLVHPTRDIYDVVGKSHQIEDYITNFKLYLLTPKLMHDLFCKYLLISTNDIENHLQKILKRVKIIPQNMTEKQIHISSACLRFKKAALKGIKLPYKDIGNYEYDFIDGCTYKFNNDKLYNMNSLYIKYKAIIAKIVLNRTDKIISRDLRKYKKRYQNNIVKLKSITSKI